MPKFLTSFYRDWESQAAGMSARRSLFAGSAKKRSLQTNETNFYS
jgi:hypothetical protein